MVFTVTVKYMEEYLPTPRCRKLRKREAQKETKIAVKEISAAEAPVAVVVHPIYSFHILEEYRYYNGKFYVKSRKGKYHSGIDKNTLLPPDELQHYIRGTYAWRNNDYKKNRRDFVNQFGRYLIIDGVLWETTGEPRYVVNTFGLGHNHGGTGMFVETFYNGNISKDNYFSALEGEKAVAYANYIAQRRGDTNDVGKFVANIEVLMPEVIKVNPARQHGDGCEFINAMENIIVGSEDAMTAGLLCMELAANS